MHGLARSAVAVICVVLLATYVQMAMALTFASARDCTRQRLDWYESTRLSIVRLKCPSSDSYATQIACLTRIEGMYSELTVRSEEWDHVCAGMRDKEAVLAREQRERETQERSIREAQDEHHRKVQLAQEQAERQVKLQQRQISQQQQDKYQVARQKLEGILEVHRAAASLNSTIDKGVSLFNHPAETVAESVSNASLEVLAAGAASAAMPESRPKLDPTYEGALEVVQELKGASVANPFVSKVQDVPLDVLAGMHRRAIGDMDRISTSIAEIDSTPGTAVASSQSSGFTATPVRSYSGEARTERALEKSSSVDAVRSASVAGKSIADMFMYRSRPGSSAVLTRVGTVNAQIGDRAELGELGCSVDGLGVVTAVCETKRRKSVNPF